MSYTFLLSNSPRPHSVLKASACSPQVVVVALPVTLLAKWTWRPKGSSWAWPEQYPRVCWQHRHRRRRRQPPRRAKRTTKPKWIIWNRLKTEARGVPKRPVIFSTDATEKLEERRKTRKAGNSLKSSKESSLSLEERAGDPKIPTTQKTNGKVFFFPFFVGRVAETVFYKKEVNSRYEQRREARRKFLRTFQRDDCSPYEYKQNCNFSRSASPDAFAVGASVTCVT